MSCTSTPGQTAPMAQAVLIAFNVKPRALAAPGLTLLEQLPREVSAASSEWSCTLYTKSGAEERQRGGQPIGVILQEINTAPANICSRPTNSDVITWGPNNHGHALRGALIVPQFKDVGSHIFGQVHEELNEACLEAVFAQNSSRQQFVGFLMMLCVKLQKGLQRKVKPAMQRLSCLHDIYSSPQKPSRVESSPVKSSALVVSRLARM